MIQQHEGWVIMSNHAKLEYITQVTGSCPTSHICFATIDLIKHYSQEDDFYSYSVQILWWVLEYCKFLLTVTKDFPTEHGAAQTGCRAWHLCTGQRFKKQSRKVPEWQKAISDSTHECQRMCVFFRLTSSFPLTRKTEHFTTNRWPDSWNDARFTISVCSVADF